MMERRRIVEAEGIDLDEARLTTLQTNDLVLSAAVAGLGVTVQPKPLVGPQIEAGTLAPLYRFQHAQLGYYIVTRSGALSQNARTFRNWLRRKGDEALSP